MSTQLLRCAVVYALFGIGLGVYMSASHNFIDRPIHVHANLAGWVSMALMAMVYRTWPATGRNKLATAQFWLHNLGLPVMLLGIFGVVRQQAFGIPCAALGSIVVAAAFAVFAFNVWRHAAE